MEIKKFKTANYTVNESKLNSDGIANPIVLDEQIVKLLTERIKDEYTAHYYYVCAANWCKEKNYAKAAVYFEAEASSELEHSKKLQNYMVDWNVVPTIPMTNTEHKFESLLDIINGAYQMEYDLLTAYNQTSSKVFAMDLNAFDFLQEFRNIQKDSVAEYSDLLNGLNLIDVKDKFQVLYFEQTYF